MVTLIILKDSTFKVTYNVLHIGEGGDYEALTFKIALMFNRSKKVHFSTTPPLLAICCYVLFFFTNQ